MFEESTIVLWDTEFTSWEGCHENGWDNSKGEYREIIQIGAVKVKTENMEKVEEFNSFVEPEINQELSGYIKELTGIDQEEIDDAEEFEKVLQDFIQWSSGLNLYSYFNDLEVLKRNVEIFNLDAGLKEDRFKDITEIFREKGVPVDEWSSGNIARYFDKEVELLSQHDALNDSKNMLKALRLMEA